MFLTFSLFSSFTDFTIVLYRLAFIHRCAYEISKAEKMCILNQSECKPTEEKNEIIAAVNLLRLSQKEGRQNAMNKHAYEK